jgi:hypothetical protein
VNVVEGTVATLQARWRRRTGPRTRTRTWSRPRVVELEAEHWSGRRRSAAAAHAYCAAVEDPALQLEARFLHSKMLVAHRATTPSRLAELDGAS